MYFTTPEMWLFSWWQPKYNFFILGYHILFQCGDMIASYPNSAHVFWVTHMLVNQQLCILYGGFTTAYHRHRSTINNIHHAWWDAFNVHQEKPSKTFQFCVYTVFSLCLTSKYQSEAEYHMPHLYHVLCMW